MTFGGDPSPVSRENNNPGNESPRWADDDEVVTGGAVPPASSDISCLTKAKDTVPGYQSEMVLVLQDHRVNDLPAGDAPPTKKMFAITREFFIGHHPATSITPHVGLRIYSTRLSSLLFADILLSLSR